MKPKSAPLATTTVSVLALTTLCLPVFADEAPAADGGNDLEEIVVTTGRTTRSSVTLVGAESQKLLPGISPLKAIETLPGVVYETADPWGNNEQNSSLVIHGFN